MLPEHPISKPLLGRPELRHVELMDRLAAAPVSPG
jgi:hypothetical protein